MLQLKPNCFAAIHAVGEMGVSDNLDSEVNHEARDSCLGTVKGGELEEARNLRVTRFYLPKTMNINKDPKICRQLLQKQAKHSTIRGTCSLIDGYLNIVGSTLTGSFRLQFLIPFPISPDAMLFRRSGSGSDST